MNRLPDDQLNELFRDVRADEPATDTISSASDRVQAALAAAQADPSALADEDVVENYEDLIPRYLAGELGEAQTLLFEEELRQSAGLRMALERAQHPVTEHTTRTTAGFNVRLWSMAAGFVVLALVSLAVVAPKLPSFDQSQIATVDSVNGRLYQVSGAQLERIQPGARIDGYDTIRTPSGSSAVVVLDDGSKVEIDGRSQVMLIRQLTGNRVAVDRGRIIIAASDQGSGALDVATDEMLVTVKGTIFGVSHGSNGSHVSVIEGAVEVAYGGDTIALEAGEQTASRATMTNLVVAEHIAWSQDADEYIDMLRQIQALRRDLTVLMDTTPRYSTRLLDLTSKDTVAYLAVPNAAAKISEAYDLVMSRVSGAQWAGEFHNELADEADDIEHMMQLLREIGGHLGDETALSIVRAADGIDGSDVHPLVLTEVVSDGLPETVESVLSEIESHVQHDESHEQHDVDVALIDDPSEASADTLSVWITGDLLVATTSPEVMAEVAAYVEGASNPFLDTAFYASLQQSYGDGVEITGGASLDFAMGEMESEEGRDELAVLGFANASHVIVDRRQADDLSTITGTVHFSGEREGLAAVLDEPGPMGALDYFTADAVIVAAAVTQDPAAIFDNLFARINETTDELQSLDAELTAVRDNVLAALGGEMAVGVDGPLLPTPSWKVVAEVYDAQLLGDTIEELIERANQEVANHDEVQGELVLSESTVDGRSYYEVTARTAMADGTLTEAASMTYTFADGYLIAGPSAAVVNAALATAGSNTSILSSSEFQDLLPVDSYVDFSAVVFNRLAELAGDIAENLPSTVELTEEQREAIEELSDGGASLFCVYAEPTSLEFVLRGPAGFPFSQLTPLIGLSGIASMAEAEVINL